MGLRTLLVGVVIVLAAVDAKGEVANEVEGAVRTIQAAFNQGDVDTLKGLMTEDHVAILPYARFSSRAEQLMHLSELRYSDYKIEGLEIKAVTAEVALVSYQATIKGTYKGKTVPSPVQVAEVWVRRDGKWVQASYQETAVAKE